MLVTSCLLQLLVSFFMEGKCSAACAAWCAEACHQLSNLSFVFCGSKPSSEATPYDIKYPLLSSGRPVRRVFRLKFISTKFILKLEEIGHEDTMMGSHPGGRVTACSVRCSIFENLMAMMVMLTRYSFSLCDFSGLAGDLTLGREGTALASGDRKYSENLRSTIEEHRLCHFWSSTIGGVTKVVSEHGYTMLEWDLFQMFFERITKTSLNGWTVRIDVAIIMLEFSTLMAGFTIVVLGVNLGVNTHSRILTWPLFRELQEGFGSKLFGDERYELLLRSQELLQGVEIELDRFQEFKKLNFLHKIWDRLKIQFTELVQWDVSARRFRFEEMLEYDVNVKEAIIAEEVNQVMQTVYFPTAADQSKDRMVVIVKVWDILEHLHHSRFVHIQVLGYLGRAYTLWLTGPSKPLKGPITGDRKYSENLRSTIKEHRPCHFRSSTIGVHTGCLWVSASTHRTSVAVRVSLCLSVCVHQHTHDVRGCPSVHISAHCTNRMSVAVRQHTQYVRGCLCVSVSTHRTSVCVRQDTQHIRGCPWLSFSTHKTSVAVRVCPCVSVGVRQHTQEVCGCPWLFVSTHTTSVCVRQHTQDIRVCPCVSVSTHRTSVAVRVCPCASVSTHRTSVAVHQYTYQHAGPWTQHAGPSRGLFGGHPCVSISPHRTSTAVPVCPSAHTGRLWLSIVLTGRPWVSTSTHKTSVCVRQHAQDVRSCPCVSVSTQKTSLCVRQHSQDVRGCPPAHTRRLCVSVSTHRTSVAVPVCPSAHRGHPCVSVSTHRTSTAVRVCPSAHTGRPWLSIDTHISTLVLPVDCSGDFGPRGLIFQYTQDVRGCPPAHTRRQCVSVNTHMTSVAVRVCPCVSVSTHKMSVAVPQYTYQHYTQDVRGCPPAHTGRLWLSVSTHKMSVAVRVCLCVSVGVRQHTLDVCGCPWLSVSTHKTYVGVRQHTQDVLVCPCVSVRKHTGRLWLSINTHISTLVLGLSMLALPVDCLGDFSPRGLSVQYTQDIRGCPPAHTGRLWLTHRTSVGIRQHTRDVRGCSSAHTGRPCVSVTTHRTSVAVRVCPCVSVSTHMTSVAVQQFTYQHVGPWTQHADPSRGLFGTSVAVRQHTQDVRGCLSVSVSTHMTSVGVRQHSQDVRVCPPAHTARPWLSVAVRQHTQDVRGCPWLSVCVCGCPPAHTGRLWLSLAVHQHTQDGRVCPSAHTGHPCVCVCVSVSTHRMSVAVRVCPCVSVSTHRTSVAVHQYTYQHVGPWTQHAGPSHGLLG
ncbi:hypothetical protein YC2023_066175 [Brassica napus]